MLNWKIWLGALLILLAAGFRAYTLAQQEPAPAQPVADLTLTVYQDPNCGCCSKWAEHLRAHGFTVESVLDANLQDRKLALGVPPRLWSCHTAVTGDYIIEGHVPAEDIERLLREQPDAKGLAVPGMPLGSPGMEVGSSRQEYDVLLFDAAGSTSVYSQNPARP